MGRPKGSKNKPKLVREDKKVLVKKEQRYGQEVSNFVDYVVSHLDDIETSYYKRFAARSNHTLKFAIAKSVIDFFRINDTKLNLAEIINE